MKVNGHSLKQVKIITQMNEKHLVYQCRKCGLRCGELSTFKQDPCHEGIYRTKQ